MEIKKIKGPLEILEEDKEKFSTSGIKNKNHRRNTKINSIIQKLGKL